MKNNKGFSLVELIITIAIMAILVGITAPQLLRFFEKSKVASDQQLLDSLETALNYAITDHLVHEDPLSKPLMDALCDASNPVALETLDSHSTSQIYKDVTESLGWANLSHTTYESFIKSDHDRSGCEIYITYEGDFANPVKIWITTTDCTGQKRRISSTDPENLGDCIKLE